MKATAKGSVETSHNHSHSKLSTKSIKTDHLTEKEKQTYTKIQAENS